MSSRSQNGHQFQRFTRNCSITVGNHKPGCEPKTTVRSCGRSPPDKQFQYCCNYYVLTVLLSSAKTLQSILVSHSAAFGSPTQWPTTPGTFLGLATSKSTTIRFFRGFLLQEHRFLVSHRARPFISKSCRKNDVDRFLQYFLVCRSSTCSTKERRKL